MQVCGQAKKAAARANLGAGGGEGAHCGTCQADKKMDSAHCCLRLERQRAISQRTGASPATAVCTNVESCICFPPIICLHVRIGRLCAAFIMWGITAQL